MTDHLARAIQHSERAPLVIGSTTSVSPVEVAVQGVTGLPADYLDSYSPVLNDHVIIYQDEESGLVILGKIVSGG